MAYYVAPDGVDGGGPERDPDQPFRSLTGCVDWIVTYLPADTLSETVHLASGTYSRDTGERYPIIIPSGLEVVGDSEENCIIEYRGLGPSTVFCGLVDLTVMVLGTLSNVTIANATEALVLDLMTDSETAVLDHVTAPRTDLHLARLVSHLDIGDLLVSREGFWSGGELFPLIEACSDTSGGPIGGLLSILGGRVERCHIRSKVSVRSPSDTIIQDNQFEDLRRFEVRRSLDAAESPEGSTGNWPEILNNQIGHEPEIGFSTVPLAAVEVWGDSIWRGNSIFSLTLRIESDSTFESNPHIGAIQINIGWRTEPSPWPFDTQGPIPDDERPPTINPHFSDNVFQHGPMDDTFWLDCLYPKALIVLGANARPTFRNNTFHSKGAALWIKEQAVPNLGDGGARNGNNSFYTELPGDRLLDGDITVDIGDENTLTLYAQYNRWQAPGPIIQKVSGSDETTWSVHPSYLL